MKKAVLIILLLLISLCPAFAIETSLKQNYQPGETLIIEVVGNFIDSIMPENILFYSERTYTPMIYDVGKIGEKFYIYSLLPHKERNYTLVIENAHFFELGEEKTQDLKFNFSVSGNITLFSVNPGFIITNQDFNVKVESKLKSIDVTATFLEDSQTSLISAGKTKTFSFSNTVTEFTIDEVIISSEDTTYTIPVAIFPTTTPEKAISFPRNLRFSNSFLNLSVLKDSEFQFETTLQNTGQENLEDIEFDYPDLDDIISISPRRIELLEAGGITSFNISVISGRAEVREGEIKVSSGDYSDTALLSITIFKSEEEILPLIMEPEITGEKSCSDLQGEFCEDDEECSGYSTLTIDGLCCVGECREKGWGWGSIIALIIIIIILIIIIFFVYRRLKRRRQTTKEFLKEKEKAYQAKFKPKEILGRLSRT